MEWGLVLLSQEIEVRVDQNEEQKWGVSVAELDQERALACLELYRQENRGWKWRQPLVAGGVWFHFGSVSWSGLMILFHLLANFLQPALYPLGEMASVKLNSGEWGRLVTATFLHADAAHLVANALIGFILIGITMARYGVGLALLLTLVAGAGGNFASFWLYDLNHRGLGASGVVMGALGLLSAPDELKNPIRSNYRPLITTVAGGLLLFILLGTDPRTDVVAHAGGFITGLGLGFLVSKVAGKTAARDKLNFGAGVVWLVLTLSAWGFAFKFRF